MLRTNLSTRPFYNQRAVNAALAGMAAIVLLATAFNTYRIVTLSAAQRTLGASAAEAEREASRLRAGASAVRGQINPQELKTVSDAAREANAIIDRRTFSWTSLFAQFEATLPDDVRITAVQPRMETDGRFVVAVTVEARTAEALDAFVEALEAKSAFHNVLSLEQQSGEGGLLEAVIEGDYVPSPPRPIAAAATPAVPAASPASENSRE